MTSLSNIAELFAALDLILDLDAESFTSFLAFASLLSFLWGNAGECCARLVGLFPLSVYEVTQHGEHSSAFCDLR